MENTHRRPSGKRPKKRRFRGNQFMKVCSHTYVAERRDTRNYLKVIDHLKSRFGRKDLLIEVYIRDILALVNNKSAIKLTDLYDKLDSYLRALETLNVTTSNYAKMLYPVVESCLPAEVLKAWDRHRLSREVPEDLALEKIKSYRKFNDFPTL
ncbi:transposable element Tc1 transposase [Trichonephila clavipes]|nr:transposable element Tc1 transposase [Trichonephila clavipes]